MLKIGFDCVAFEYSVEAYFMLHMLTKMLVSTLPKSLKDSNVFSHRVFFCRVSFSFISFSSLAESFEESVSKPVEVCFMLLSFNLHKEASDWILSNKCVKHTQFPCVWSPNSMWICFNHVCRKPHNFIFYLQGICVDHFVFYYIFFYWNNDLEWSSICITIADKYFRL